MTTKTTLIFAVLSLLEWACIPPVHAHFELTYPGWRGWTLNQTPEFPDGPQWECPCGSLPPQTNATFWPIKGGAVALRPGWFRGHGSTTLWINLIVPNDKDNNGLTTTIPLSKIHITGPKGPSNNDPYPSTVCLPYLPLPDEPVRQEGERGIIQVIESHEESNRGGAYNCVDVVFTADEGKLPDLGEENCFNSTEVKVETILWEKGQGPGEEGDTGDGLVLEENNGGTDEGGYCLRGGEMPPSPVSTVTSSWAEVTGTTTTAGSSETGRPGAQETTGSEDTPGPAQSSPPANAAASRPLELVGMGFTSITAGLALILTAMHLRWLL